MTKKRKKDNNKLLIILIVLLLGTALFSIIAYYQGDGEVTRSMKQDGYSTEDESDAFYKNIVTNNTLDDFYNAISAQEESHYEEYYLSKESLDFMEMKLDYQEKVLTSLNITSDLKSNYTTYNFEMSYENVYLLIEGNSINDYDCSVVKAKNVSHDTRSAYCNYINQELAIFLERRSKVLENKKVQELLSSPMKEYVAGDEDY